MCSNIYSTTCPYIRSLAHQLGGYFLLEFDTQSTYIHTEFSADPSRNSPRGLSALAGRSHEAVLWDMRHTVHLWRARKTWYDLWYQCLQYICRNRGKDSVLWVVQNAIIPYKSCDNLNPPDITYLGDGELVLLVPKLSHKFVMNWKFSAVELNALVQRSNTELAPLGHLCG